MAITVEQIDTAIEEVLTTGQSATIDGMTVLLPDISKLYDLRQKVSSDTARSTTRPIFRGFDFSNMGY